MDKILEHAAKLIIENGNKDVDVTVLARRAKLTRAAIYGRFGKEAKAVIFQKILQDFLGSAQSAIVLVISSIDPASSPMEKLAAVFRATLATFKSNPTFGKVVLMELHVRDQKMGGPLFQIFMQVDGLLNEAKAKGDLAPDVSDRLDGWKIRQILFSVTRALLRGFYLDESFFIDKRGKLQRTSMTERDVEIEMLRVLKIYCSDKNAEKIQNTINLLIKNESRKIA